MSDRQLIADLLSALEYHTEQTRPIEFSKVAIEAAREYLRKPAQQEPVGKWMGDCIEWTENLYKFRKGQPIYTSPPASKPWVELTDAEFQWIYDNGRTPAGMIEMAEAKLREKNS